MSERDIINMLNDLARLGDELAARQLAMQEQKSRILATVQAELDAVDVEHMPAITRVQEVSEQLTATVKEQVAKHHATVSGERLQAVYTKGRVSWDTKALDGYAVAHPEIVAMRKEGQPSVSIRVRNGQ